MLLAFPGANLASMGPTIEVTMKNNGYAIKLGASSGTLTPGFTMTVGQENVFSLRNEDATAHDFVLEAFTGMDVVVNERKLISEVAYATSEALSIAIRGNEEQSAFSPWKGSGIYVVNMGIDEAIENDEE